MSMKAWRECRYQPACSFSALFTIFYSVAAARLNLTSPQQIEDYIATFQIKSLLESLTWGHNEDHQERYFNGMGRAALQAEAFKAR